MHVEHFSISALIASALATAISYWLSVKIATPALPSESAIANFAAIAETSSGSVVTFVNSPFAASGPGAAAGVPADDGDLQVGRLLDDRRLLLGVEPAEDDAGRLGRERLVERVGAALGATPCRR